jgi:DNA adenine methylase (dam)
MAVKTPLKWVGSKARLMPQLRGHLPEGKRLVEPFAGSCAVMMNTDYDEYLIADINQDLIIFHTQAAQHADQLLECALPMFTKDNHEDGYYDARNQFNRDSSLTELERAALFLYLNRHCFNGLCRYNRDGGFNVPYGKYKQPYFPEREILAFSEKAKRAKFITANFMETLNAVQSGDVVYCDPPYLTDTDNFTAYHSGAFNHIHHGNLARQLRKLARKGVQVVTSNSDLEMVHYLYKGFDCVRVNAPRSVGAAAGSQKIAAEVILKSPPSIVLKGAA